MLVYTAQVERSPACDKDNELAVTSSVEILGPGRQLLTLTNIAENRLFDIQCAAGGFSFTIRDITLASNRVTREGSAIRAILGSGSALNVSRVHFFDNSSDRGGGAMALYGTASLPLRESGDSLLNSP